jgi:hypothetical protein
MYQYSTPPVKTPFIELLHISARAKDGICALKTTPSPATIKRLSITATVKDPDHRLFKVSQLAKGKHPDSRTMTDGPKITYITTPGSELAFNAGDNTGIIATTSISLDHLDPWMLFGELLEAGLVELDEGHKMLTDNIAYNFIRHKVSGLVGFDVLINEPRYGSKLSSHAESLLVEIGDEASDPSRLKEALERLVQFGNTRFHYPLGAEQEVLNHAIRKFGPRLDAIFPAGLAGLQKNYGAFCAGCPCHGKSPADIDYWSFTAGSPVGSLMLHHK